MDAKWREARKRTEPPLRLLLTQVRRDPNQLRSALNGAINAILAARAVP
jgi:hypothetical protein